MPYRIFENNQKDGYIFLVALAKKKDAAVDGEQRASLAGRRRERPGVILDLRGPL